MEGIPKHLFLSQKKNTNAFYNYTSNTDHPMSNGQLIYLPQFPHLISINCKGS